MGIVGFESPCKEYAKANVLAGLDELLVEHPSSTLIALAEQDFKKAGIWRHDLIVIDKTLKVQSGDVVYVLFEGNYSLNAINVEQQYLLSDEGEKICLRDAAEVVIIGVISRSVRMHQPAEIFK